MIGGSVEPTPLVLPDTSRHPLGVHWPGIASYIGVPVVLSDGTFFGTLAAVDAERRRVGESQAMMMTLLARLVATQLDRDRLDQQVRAGRRLQTMYSATRVLAESDTLESAAARLLAEIGAHLGWELGGLWLVNEADTALRCVSAWIAADSTAQDFLELTRGATFARRQGVPGRAWAEGKPIWLSDLREVPDLPRRIAAERAGLGAAVAFPVWADTQVRGVLEFFGSTAMPRDEELVALLEGLGLQIGQFLERRRGETERAAIVASALDGIVLMDARGRISDFNPAAERLFGYARAEVVGSELSDKLIPPALRRHHREGLRRYLETGSGPLLNRTLETCGWHASGVEFPVELTITPIERQGETRFAGHIRDITARKRAEAEQLRAAQTEAARVEAERARASIEAVLESITDAFAALDRDWNITYVNREAERLWGQDRAAVVGRNYWEVFPEVLGSPFEEPYRRALRDQVTLSVEAFFPPLNGWFDVRVYPSADGLAFYFREVTERKRVEAELRAQAALLDLAPDAILVRDLRGDTIRFWNRGAETLYGWTSYEALGRVSHELLNTTFPRPLDEIQSELERTGHWQGELEHTRRDGSRIVIASRWAVRDTASGEPGTVLEINTDVTERRALDRLKDDLVSTVSHELRTPLAALVGFSELMLTRDLPERQRRQFLETMLREGQRLTALINDFLDLQRLQRRDHPIERERVSLQPLLESAALGAGHDAVRPIIIDTPDDLPLVEVNPDQVRQVLSNLLSNARKYSPAGGEIRLSARVAHDQVELAVADQGLGIPAESLSQVFERFYRVETGDRRTIGGTGLGLAITQEIVEGYGGHIWAESAGPGRGATFRFTLPIAA